MKRFHQASRPILVLGGTGMLGQALIRELEKDRLPYAVPLRREFDFNRMTEIPSLLQAIRPSAVINAAAYTDVANAERLDERDKVYRVNRDAVEVLGRVCCTLELPLAHVSTDYVFDGNASKPYLEDDPTRPLQVYGRSKLDGEIALREVHPTALIARTSTLYGHGLRSRKHYVDAILEQARQYAQLEVVRPPVSSPTYSNDLARGLIDLLQAGAEGVVHVVNDEACSRYELAQESVRIAGLAEKVEIGERPEPKGGIRRPGYSVLSTQRFREWTGRSMRSWQDALKEYLS